MPLSISKDLLKNEGSRRNYGIRNARTDDPEQTSYNYELTQVEAVARWKTGCDLVYLPVFWA